MAGESGSSGSKGGIAEISSGGGFADRASESTFKGIAPKIGGAVGEVVCR